MLRLLIAILALTQVVNAARVNGNAFGCITGSTCTTTSSNTVTIPATAAGSLISVGVGVNNGNTVSTVTDSAGQTYTAVTGNITWSFGGRAIRVFRKANSASGVTTITATASGASDMVIAYEEYSGMATTGTIEDVTGTVNSPGCGGNCATITATVPTANGVAFIFGGPGDTSAITAGTGFTMIADASTAGASPARFGAADNLTIGTGSQTGAINFGAGQGQAGAILVVYRTAPAAPVADPRKRTRSIP